MYQDDILHLMASFSLTLWFYVVMVWLVYADLKVNLWFPVVFVLSLGFGYEVFQWLVQGKSWSVRDVEYNILGVSAAYILLFFVDKIK